MFKKSISVSVVIVAITFIYALWNWIMSHLFGLPEITFSEAIGLYLLSCILVKMCSTSNSK